MNVRKLNSTDYERILLKWWKDWRWTAPLKEMLPENGEGGFIVYDGDTPVCAGFLYNTNSSMAWCEFIVSNFDYKDKKKRSDALSLLLYTIEQVARSIGKTYMYSVLKNPALIKKYKAHGYVEGESNNKEMIKKLWQQQQHQQ